MSTLAIRIMTKLARRIAEDPTRATVADARKLANAFLMLTGGGR